MLEAVVPAYEAMGIGVVEVPPPLPPPLVLRRRRVVVLEAEAGGDRGVTIWIACGCVWWWGWRLIEWSVASRRSKGQQHPSTRAAKNLLADPV